MDGDYASSTDDCGAAPNALGAVDLTSAEKKLVSWKTGGPSIAGHVYLVTFDNTLHTFGIPMGH